jgi:hypothetical protein
VRHEEEGSVQTHEGNTASIEVQGNRYHRNVGMPRTPLVGTPSSI